MLCYFCSKQATHTFNVTSVIITTTYNLCKSCYYKVSYGLLKFPRGQNQGSPEISFKEAQLIYEEAVSGYAFRFTKGFNKTVIDIIKTGIPTNERTTNGPPEWKWFFGEKYFDLIKFALEGAGFTIKIVTKEDIDRLRAEQAQHRKNNQNLFKPAGISIDVELQKFSNLLVTANAFPAQPNNNILIEEIKKLTRELATKAYKRAAQFYHPDKNPANAASMSELNSTWAILKEGYYIK